MFPRHWNINQFPIRVAPFGLLLGPANSRLTTHCRETLALSVTGILTRLSCYYHQHLQWSPVHWTSQPSFYPGTTPIYHAPLLGRSRVSVASLAPSIFGAPELGR